MTKSRTLRRAGAVVLSLAMAATTVFAGNVSQAASKKKVTLSSTSKTFAAKGGTATAKIKGATSAKISSTTVKSSKTSVATVKKSSKVKFKVTAKKNTTTSKKTATITAKVKIAKKYQKKYTKKSYSLKYKVTVKAAAAPSEEPVAVNVTLTDESGLQEDGTGSASDTYKVSYGSALGIPKAITWFKNDVAEMTVTSAESGAFNAALERNDLTEGTWFAELRNEKGDAYQSNKIVVGKDLSAKVTGYSIEDDYETPAIAPAKTSNASIVNVTLNKEYEGQFYLATLDGTTYTVVPLTTEANAAPTSAAEKDLTNKNATSAGGVFAKNADGSKTYKFVYNGTLTRGTTYYLGFDQKGITTDDIIYDSNKTVSYTTKKFDTSKDTGVLNLAGSFEEPYVIAPSKVVLDSPISGKADYKVTLLNAADKTYEALNGTYATWASITVLTSTDSSIGTGTSLTKGVETVGGQPAVSGASYYAKFVGATGVFAKEDLEVKSEVVATKLSPVSNFAAASADDIDKKVTASYNKVAAPGKVYIVKSGSEAAFNASDASTYVSVSSAVATSDIATTTDIKDAITAAGKYVAIFVPDDTTKYGNATSSEFTVSAVPTVYTMDRVEGVKPTDTNKVLKATDQFGAVTDAKNPTITPIKVSEKNSAIIGAAADVTNTADPFGITAGNVDGDISTLTIGSLSSAAATLGEVWICQIGGTNSYIIATCTSQAATANNCEFSLEIKEIATTKGNIVGEGAQTETKIVDANGDAVKTITGTATTGNEAITLYGTYFVVDEFGNNMATAATKLTGTIAGTNTGHKFSVEWNSTGKIIAVKYDTSNPYETVDPDVVTYLGTKFSVEVGPTAAYTAAKAAIDAKNTAITAGLTLANRNNVSVTGTLDSQGDFIDDVKTAVAMGAGYTVNVTVTSNSGTAILTDSDTTNRVTIVISKDGYSRTWTNVAITNGVYTTTP